MTLYVYAMHITRVPKTKLLAQTSELFFFSPHYPLFSRFAQKLEFYARVPRLVGPAVPTLAQDPETNALMKALLFTPYECSNCLCCASPTNLSLLLAKGQQGAHDDSQSWTFLKAWQTRRADIELLANAMQTQDAAQKKNAHDCRLCGAAKVAATRSTAAGLQSRITEIHCQRVGGLVFADAYLGNHCQVFCASHIPQFCLKTVMKIADSWQKDIDVKVCIQDCTHINLISVTMSPGLLARSLPTWI